MLFYILVYIIIKEGKSNLFVKEDGLIKGKKVVVKIEKMIMLFFYLNRVCN